MVQYSYKSEIWTSSPFNNEVMIVFDEKSQNSLNRENLNEIRLNARAVSRGVAIGKVVCLYGRQRQFYQIKIKLSQIEKEIRRFYTAVQLAQQQLEEFSVQNDGSFSKNKLSIFETHFMILEDKTFLSKIENQIKDKKVNAEWAVIGIIEEYVARYKKIQDEHFKERYIDLEDVGDRILAALGGSGQSNIHLDHNSVIVAHEIKPSTLVELTESQPVAIIAENGGWTSHSFILAREINLPAVTGLKGILRRVQNGDEVIVDGYNGQVILHPNEKTLQNYKIAAARFEEINFLNYQSSGRELKTLDGKKIIIRANLDLPTGYAKAERYGAQGIGLYRSEFLFNQFRGYPTEIEQIETYREIAEKVGGKGVRIRTFDLSSEPFENFHSRNEKNPALGLRAIRLSLSQQKQFRIQLRAILQASKNHQIDIVLPMVSDVSEILRARKILEQEKSQLKKRKISCGNPRLGAMIEVPSAVFTIDEIIEEVDFLSLGTNDLVQYLLAVDRDNESVADWFRTLHPAVLRAIKKVLKTAETKETPVIVCGEMAGSPYYVPILIGFGANELSMNINSIPRITRTISSIAFEEAEEISGKLIKCKTADEVEHLFHSYFNEKWSHLFSPDILPPQKNRPFK